MNLDDVELRPAEGMLIVHFVDDEVNEAPSSSSSPSEPMPYEGVLALVVAVGPKGPAGVKKGNAVVCGPYARDGMKIGENVLVSSWDIKATVID